MVENDSSLLFHSSHSLIWRRREVQLGQSSIRQKNPNLFNVFFCVGWVTHYYLGLAESYLEEKPFDQLGQSIKQRFNREISTQEVHGIFEIVTTNKKE